MNKTREILVRITVTEPEDPSEQPHVVRVVVKGGEVNPDAVFDPNVFTIMDVSFREGDILHWRYLLTLEEGLV